MLMVQTKCLKRKWIESKFLYRVQDVETDFEYVNKQHKPIVLISLQRLRNN